MNLSSSVVQPLFGHLSDRRSLAWVIPVALVLACAGTAVIGFSPSMPLMLLGALVSGIGVAAFHPEASRFANYFSGANRASGMSLFTTGGYLGFALGPILVTPLLVAFGLPGAAWLLLPGVVMAALLWRDLPRFHQARAHAHRAARVREGNDDWRGFSLLASVVAIRSITFFAAVTFTPFFAISVIHVDKVAGSVVLAILLVAGALGTLLGGRLADRVDRRRVVTYSLVGATTFALAIVAVGLYAPNVWLLALVAAPFGFSLGSSAGVIVVMGQEYLPKRLGIASGLTLGLSVTIGGLAAPVFGAIGDHRGLIAVFITIAGCAFAALLASFALPKPTLR
jgi:FSR family fosmidomycin resistance protein-like MFS transporter